VNQQSLLARREFARLAGRYPGYEDLGAFLRGALRGATVEVVRASFDTFVYVTGTPWQHRRADDLMRAWVHGARNLEELVRDAGAFVRALENARAANRSAQLFPKDVILAERQRLDDLAAEKYAILRRALGES
jgi:hypothetical protein